MPKEYEESILKNLNSLENAIKELDEAETDRLHERIYIQLEGNKVPKSSYLTKMYRGLIRYENRRWRNLFRSL